MLWLAIAGQASPACLIDFKNIALEIRATAKL